MDVSAVPGATLSTRHDSASPAATHQPAPPPPTPLSAARSAFELIDQDAPSPLPSAVAAAVALLPPNILYAPSDPPRGAVRTASFDRSA